MRLYIIQIFETLLMVLGINFVLIQYFNSQSMTDLVIGHGVGRKKVALAIKDSGIHCLQSTSPGDVLALFVDELAEVAGKSIL